MTLFMVFGLLTTLIYTLTGGTPLSAYVDNLFADVGKVHRYGTRLFKVTIASMYV